MPGLPDTPFTDSDREALRRLAASTRLNDRRECIHRVWPGIAAPENAALIAELMEALAHDPRQEIRWEAVERLSFVVRKDPDRCWEIVQRLGASCSEDLRAAVGVQLLGGVIGTHLPRIRDRILAGDWKLREMTRYLDRYESNRFRNHDDRNRELNAFAPPYWVQDLPSLPEPSGKPARNRIGREQPDNWDREATPRFSQPEREALRTLASSRRFIHRYLCVQWLRAGEDLPANRELVHELAEVLASDPRHPVFAGGLSILGHCIKRDPERIWDVFERLSATPCRAIFDNLAAFLLEHLLELDCDRFLPRVRARIEAGSWRMASLLKTSYIFGTAIPYEDEIKALLEAHGGLIRPL